MSTVGPIRVIEDRADVVNVGRYRGGGIVEGRAGQHQDALDAQSLLVEGRQRGQPVFRSGRVDGWQPGPEQAIHYRHHRRVRG